LDFCRLATRYFFECGLLQNVAHVTECNNWPVCGIAVCFAALRKVLARFFVHVALNKEQLGQGMRRTRRPQLAMVFCETTTMPNYIWQARPLIRCGPTALGATLCR
jgi:hypothetical protein